LEPPKDVVLFNLFNTVERIMVIVISCALAV
jgi:hypothetical protein